MQTFNGIDSMHMTKTQGKYNLDLWMQHIFLTHKPIWAQIRPLIKALAESDLCHICRKNKQRVWCSSKQSGRPDSLFRLCLYSNSWSYFTVKNQWILWAVKWRSEVTIKIHHCTKKEKVYTTFQGYHYISS